MWRRRLGRTTASLTALVSLVTAAFIALPSPPASQALSGSSFNPANIISDFVMFAGNTMAPSEVQAVLNARVPRCTLGDPGKPPGGIYTFPSGFQTLLATKCLKDYSEATPSLGGDQYCAPFTGGTYSAAEIISRVGAACNVNPRVLIVLLEKEQSLITDSFPAASQYAKATGFNCPDTAPCNIASAGFFKQVYSAARQFQVYGTSGFTWYPVGQVSQVRFHPNAACGSTPVRIENRATAALYYYTPYQPNTAALNNLYGTGDGCSAYGNRNFWRIFTDWFGSTQEIPGSRDYITALYNDVLGRAPESEGLAYWVSRMASGLSRESMSTAFNNSDEYRYNKIREAYNRVLKREPEPDGRAYWYNALVRGWLAPDDMYSTFLKTDEMYLVQGGGTNAGYVSALYREVLSREPEPDGLQYWTSKLDQGQPRSVVSEGIWFSVEKYNGRVRDAYTQYLGRDATLEEQQYWSSIARVFGPTRMRSMIMSSDEYWNRANSRY